MLVQLDKTQGNKEKTEKGQGPSYPQHLLLDHKDKGLIVIRVQVPHFHRRFLFLPNAFALAIQNFYLYVRVCRKFGLYSLIQSLLSIVWHVRSNLIEKENVYRKLNKLQELEDALREMEETGDTG